MNTLAKGHLKKFLIASSLFFGVLTASPYAHAGDRLGNGGSGNEVSKVMVEKSLMEIIFKIDRFFKNNTEARKEFSEIDFENFFKLTRTLKIAVSEETLIDKNGITRTCLNFPESALIQCNRKVFAAMDADVPSQYVLIFHEILGLLGVEESSPEMSLDESYKVSKLLKKYVTKVSAYDLVYGSRRYSSLTYLKESDTYYGTNCKVRELILKRPDRSIPSEIYLEVYKELKVKGYVFDETRGLDYNYYSDDSTEPGFEFGLGTGWELERVNSVLGDYMRASSHSRFVRLSHAQVLINDEINSSHLLHEEDSHSRLLGHYDFKKAILWAIKKIPNCHVESNAN